MVWMLLPDVTGIPGCFSHFPGSLSFTHKAPGSLCATVPPACVLDKVQNAPINVNLSSTVGNFQHGTESNIKNHLSEIQIEHPVFLFASSGNPTMDTSLNSKLKSSPQVVHPSQKSRDKGYGPISKEKPPFQEELCYRCL